MENEEAMKKKRVQKLTTGIIIGMTVIVLGYVAYALITKNINMRIFEVLLGIFVIGYLVLSDVVEPWLTGLLKDMTQMRKNAYLKILGLDVVGAGALLYWIVGMDSEAGNNLLIPVLIYFLANQMKRKLRPEFEGLTEKVLKEQAEAEKSDSEASDEEK
ncbi:hypothetical protein ACTNCH_01810 [Candidatus Merdisoma sp. HCP28S3_D10]|uniref:hypothetical protein n=1 Tax=unclassified Candidatus Merdisoma TaxID=3099611 RepID=UPI003F88BA57